MEKIRYCFLGLISFIFGVVVFSCNDDSGNRENYNWGDFDSSNNEYVNNWMISNMRDYYYWNNTMPNNNSLNFKIDPYNFFDGLLYDKDRFSRMEGTHLNVPKAATVSDLGFEYISVRFFNKSGEYLFRGLVVTYVKKGTNAEQAGIKRGFIIMSVDGNNVSDSNWYSLLAQNKASYNIEYYANLTDMETSYAQNMTINTTPGYVESPIHLSKILNIDGHKIGYLAYNSFDAGGEKLKPYDVELVQIFDEFRKSGIRDLVLDLRYNGGGSVRSAEYIGSALVPNRSTEKIFEIETYNPGLQGILDEMSDSDPTKQRQMYIYFRDKIETNNVVLAKIPRLGDQLNSLCFLVTKQTASASEMLINTLTPYYEEVGKEVIIIGKQTLGKNLGSWLFYEEDDPKNPYALWPIVFRSHNKLYNKDNPEASSNYASGFEPTIDLNELDELDEGLKELGDKEEMLLNAAIVKITTGLSPLSVPKKDRETKILPMETNENYGKRGTMFRNKAELNISDLKSLKEKAAVNE